MDLHQLMTTEMRDAPSVSPTPIADIAARAARRRRRRRFVRSTLALLMLAGAAAALAHRDGDDHDQLRTADPGQNEPESVVSTGTFKAPSSPAPTDRQALVSELREGLSPEDLQGNIEGAGFTVEIPLRAGRDRIAQALVSRYGTSIAVTVGDLRWTEAGPAPRSGACGYLAEMSPDPQVAVTMDEPPTSLAFGRDQSIGTVRIHNRSDHPVQYGHGERGFNAYLLDPSTEEVAGVWSGPTSSILITGTVPSGGVSEPIHAVVGMTSCQPSHGSAVQPGTYKLVVKAQVGPNELATSPPVKVTVDAPAS
jgi:hypothetical protein